MKITKTQLKEIIKEEIDASLEDLEARMSAMDTRRGDDAKKVKHRGARDDLNEIARALQLMFDLTGAMAQKGTEAFRNRSVYGLSVREQPALKELADIVRQYAKHVKDAEVEPVNEVDSTWEATESLKAINSRVEHILGKVNDLPAEKVDTSTRGGPSEDMAVDAYMTGADNYDEARQILRDQARYLGQAIEAIRHARVIPQAIRDRLANDVDSGFLSGMPGLRESKNNKDLQQIIDEELSAVLSEKDEDWIQKAVDPDHEGYCTPMTKKTCTPKRKALAKRFKKAAKKKEKKGGTGWQGKV